MKKKIIILFVIIAAISAAFVMFYKYYKDFSVEKVQNVNAVLEDNSSAKITWDKLENADSYCVYQSVDKGKYEKIAQIKSENGNSYTCSGLESAQTYNYYVTAKEEAFGNEYESKSHDTEKIVTSPEKVGNLSVESKSEGEISLSWDDAPRADGYEIQYCQGGADEISDGITEKAEKGATSYEIDGLNENKEYSVRIRAYKKSDEKLLEGEWSDAQSVTVMKKIKLSSDIDVNKPMVALTFDDGPGYNSASDDILDVLEKYNARATFFMIGTNAKDHPENLKRKIKLNCELGNHTYDHTKYGKKVTAEDIKKASDAIYDACGQYPTAFRSPGGNTTKTIRSECKKENMPLYYWSIDTQDWKSRNADSVYNKVMKNVKDGDIILMHEIYSSTAEAVKKIVPELIKQGYQLVTCEELIEAKTGKAPQAGEQYVNCETINDKTS